MIWFDISTGSSETEVGIATPSLAAIASLAFCFVFSIGEEATAANPATTFSKMSLGIEANSSAIISLALWPLILLPSPSGSAVTVLSPMYITQRSTSFLGPLPLEHKSLKTGAFFQIVSIYSKRTFD